MKRTLFFDRLALSYDECFEVPHRRIYDDLAWEQVVPLLPGRPGIVIDAGCGTGRWVPRLLALGHRVVGVDSSPAMVSVAAGRGLPEASFSIVCADMAGVELEPAMADVVLAMGSLQYTDDPGAVMRRFAGWLRPGGTAVVLVDSLMALVIELLGAGRHAEAAERAITRRGRWCPPETPGLQADLHLFTRAALETIFVAAHFGQVRSAGLLIGPVVAGGVRSIPADAEALEELYARERVLSSVEAIADLGKQLLVTGRTAEQHKRRK